MNKVFFSISDSLGGAEQLIMKLAKKHQKNSKVVFLLKKSNNTWVEQGLEVVYCDGNLWKFIKTCTNKKYDFVFSSHLMMNALLGFLRTVRLLKTDKLICRESTTVFERYAGLKLLKYKVAYYIGYRNIDLLITQTSLMESILLEKATYLENRMTIKTIPNLFEFPNHQVKKLDIDFPYIVSAGRLIKEKGFDLLIKSFYDIKQLYPNYKLIILGEGKERATLENLIENLNITNDVLLQGFVENVYPYFKTAQLCVVSSRREGFPNVLLQMMSQNNKVVSTLCAGDIDKIPNIITVAPNSAQELTKGIINALEKEEDNKESFRAYLRSRDVESYYKKIFEAIQENKQS